MSSSCKPGPGGFRDDIRRLLEAAEAGQKLDLMTYSSGHLRPRSQDQSQSLRGKTQPFWRTSWSRAETSNLLRGQQTQQTKALTYVKKREIKESLSKLSAGTDFLKSEVSRSRQDQSTDPTSSTGRREGISLPKIVFSSSSSLPAQPKAFSQKKSDSSTHPARKQQFFSGHSDQDSLNNEGQKKAKQWLGRQVRLKKDCWGGINVAEMLERKLQKELRKLSAQSWPSRDHLVVFSDVFDDVCEGSPVFGRILREIKVNYDLYVNHLMASQSRLHDKSTNSSLKDPGHDRVRDMELEDAAREVLRLEEEASRALEETIRVRNEFQNIPVIVGREDSDMKNASLSGQQGRDVQSKRLEVLNTWREITQLEEEIKEQPVSPATSTATQRRSRDLKTEIMRLIALNDRLTTTNKDLENNINMMLNREKASKSIRRMLWAEIYHDLQTESDQQQAKQKADVSTSDCDAF